MNNFNFIGTDIICMIYQYLNQASFFRFGIVSKQLNQIVKNKKEAWYNSRLKITNHLPYSIEYNKEREILTKTYIDTSQYNLYLISKDYDKKGKGKSFSIRRKQIFFDYQFTDYVKLINLQQYQYITEFIFIDCYRLLTEMDSKLVKFIKTSKYLKKLTIKNCIIANYVWFRSILDSILENESIFSLDLSGTDLSNDGYYIPEEEYCLLGLSKIINNHETITKINLTNTGIKISGFDALYDINYDDTEYYRLNIDIEEGIWIMYKRNYGYSKVKNINKMVSCRMLEINL